MAMRTFEVAATWTMQGTLKVQADSLEEAIDKALDTSLAKFEDVEYVDDTFEVDVDTTDDLNPSDEDEDDDDDDGEGVGDDDDFFDDKEDDEDE